jgi:MFS family permease
MMNRNSIILIATMSIASLAFSIFNVIFPLYLDYKQISIPTIGVIFSLPALISLVSRMFVGSYADNKGRKIFYSLALVGGALTNVMFAFANSVWQFISIKLFGEISSSLSDATDHLLIYESVPKNKSGSMFGKVSGSMSLLSSVGTFSAGMLLIALGYTSTLIICAVLLGLALSVFLAFRERKAIPVRHASIISMFDFRSMPSNLKVFTASSFFYDFSTSMITVFSIQLFLTKLFSLSAISLSLVLTGYSLLFAFSSIFLGKLSDAHSPRKIYIYSSLVSSLLILMIGVSFVAILVSAFWVILGLSMGIEGAASRKMVNMLARPKFRGRDTNLSKTLSGLGGFIGPLLAGFMGFYGFGPVFVISSIFLAISVFVMIFVKDQSDIYQFPR